MARPPSDIAASVRARLLNLARGTRRPLDQLLTRYALERLLHRLSRSRHRDRYALKGALLVATWFDSPHRPTRDVDFLGFGDPSIDVMLSRFREILSIAADDGLAYDIAALHAEPIRQDHHYGGIRLRTTAALAGARIPIVVDIGFGDAIEPGLQEIDLPVLLDMPVPRLLAYPPETVIAEKFEAMVRFGLANSRLKDYYDAWALLTMRQLDPGRLRSAIAATFERRGTALPTGTPDALTAAYAAADGRERQWLAFTRNVERETPTLDVVVTELEAWLMPVVRRISG
ncbi:nucleotidyl transferase AbiEii/AbiGii toxin family protein [Luteimonas sp. Y-2-2-4F]|nr:nucleotidyl transferase AbiEii/AbiGii toxin family protein [Luteimonas sp. Y-2-2-4F]MCD9032956.1 nucleotidyl transferase AbiEii/AbiGii toxin family protein [Luteimonas sp. Y-2-2-4F]